MLANQGIKFKLLAWYGSPHEPTLDVTSRIARAKPPPVFEDFCVVDDCSTDTEEAGESEAESESAHPGQEGKVLDLVLRRHRASANRTRHLVTSIALGAGLALIAG